MLPPRDRGMDEREGGEVRSEMEEQRKHEEEWGEERRSEERKDKVMGEERDED